jgi:predicted Fe-S protein YdhL (DUF1289 family)
MAKQNGSTIRSPCVGTCLYDSSVTYCIGCRRTPAEIYDWLIMTNEEKLEVLRRIEDDKMDRSKVSSDKLIERTKTGDSSEH